MGRRYRLIDETGFEYRDVAEVDLDEGLITIYLRDETGSFAVDRDADGKPIGAKTKVLAIKHKMKLIPEELLSRANQRQD